jgi:hypothetical protein
MCDLPRNPDATVIANIGWEEAQGAWQAHVDAQKLVRRCLTPVPAAADGDLTRQLRVGAALGQVPKGQIEGLRYSGSPAAAAWCHTAPS